MHRDRNRAAWNRLFHEGPWLHLALWVWPWVGTALGYAVGNRFLYPFLCVLPAYMAMVFLLKAGRRRRAVAAMVVWAIGLGFAGTFFTAAAPERAAAITLNGENYRDEMFGWIRTGEGPEGDVSQFLPQHALHSGLFALLSLATASALSMLFGTILMNYMSFYVGSLVITSEFPQMIYPLGWPVWAIVRVVAFVILGVVLAEPLLGRLFSYRWTIRDLAPFLVAGMGGLIADALMKWLLAPFWRQWLLEAVGSGLNGL
jgi:hypothetical protein